MIISCLFEFFMFFATIYSAVLCIESDGMEEREELKKRGKEVKMELKEILRKKKETEKRIEELGEKIKRLEEL